MPHHHEHAHAHGEIDAALRTRALEEVGDLYRQRESEEVIDLCPAISRTYLEV